MKVRNIKGIALAAVAALTLAACTSPPRYRPTAVLLRGGPMPRLVSTRASTLRTVADYRDGWLHVSKAAKAKSASAEIRARRRTDELAAKGRVVDYRRILAEIRDRDARDSGRTVAPLKPAADAHLLDTTDKDIEAAFRAAVDIIERARAERERPGA